MMPGDFPLELYRGDSYHWVFTLWSDEAKTIPTDLTGMTAKAEIREATGGTNITALVCTIPSTAPHNVVDAKLSAASCADLPASGVWDLQLTTTSSGEVATVLAGKVTVTPDVTDSAPGPFMMTAVTSRTVRGVK
jgi:hypothetical protein